MNIVLGPFQEYFLKGLMSVIRGYEARLLAIKGKL